MDRTVNAEPGVFAQFVHHPDLASTTIPKHQREFLADVIGASNEPLPDYIHPVFAFENWHRISMAQWIALSPALRVASQMIQQTAVWRWYAHVLCGDITSDGEDAVLVPSIESESAHMKIVVWNAIAELTSIWRLKFGFDKLKNIKGFTDAITFSSAIMFESYRAYGGRFVVATPLADPQIYINEQHLHNVEYLHEAGFRHNLKIVHLRLAITLCHELVHMMWMFRHKGVVYPFAQTTRTDEPRASVRHIETDLGDAFEGYVFGERLFSTNHPRDVLAFWDSLWDTGGGEFHMRHPIPRWWTHMWFNNRLYTSGYFDQLHRSGALNIPTAAESGYTFVCGPSSHGWLLWIRGVRQESVFEWPDEMSHAARRCMQQIRFLKSGPTKQPQLPAHFQVQEVQRQQEFQQRPQPPQISYATPPTIGGLSPHFRVTPDVPLMARQWHKLEIHSFSDQAQPLVNKARRS